LKAATGNHPPAIKITKSTKKAKQPKEARHEQTKLKVQNHWPIGQVG